MKGGGGGGEGCVVQPLMPVMRQHLQSCSLLHSERNAMSIVCKVSPSPSPLDQHAFIFHLHVMHSKRFFYPEGKSAYVH